MMRRAVSAAIRKALALFRPLEPWIEPPVTWTSRAILARSAEWGARATDRRLARGRARSLWGTTPILTLATKARADEKLGMSSDSLVFTTYYITRDFTWNLSLIERIARRRRWLHLAVGRILLSIALIRYDVLGFFADRGIMVSEGRFGIHPEELAAIAAANKRLYVYAYGADVRTRERTYGLGHWNFCRDCTTPGRHCVCDEDAGKAIIDRTALVARALVAQGDMLVYMPGCRNLPYWAIDTQRTGFVGVQPHSGPLRIVHAPNHTHFKGTRYLEAAIERLRAKGHAIELVKVSGVSNERVLELFASADIVADQFIGGAYGFTALEAMARGKPVLVFVRHPSLIIDYHECPLIDCRPETLDAVLAWCLQNRQKLVAIGAQGRAYIEAHHCIDAVAGRLAGLYLETADFPEATNERLRQFIACEKVRSDAVPRIAGWQHPWRIPSDDGSTVPGPLEPSSSERTRVAHAAR